MKSTDVLILPGWQNSGPGHWQSLWEAAYGYVRVEQHDWMRPLRGDWMMRLEEAVLWCPEPVILVAHSLGCILAAAWAAHSCNTDLVRGALLVAPADVECEALRPMLASWSPILLPSLPFRSCLVASRNDPYCVEQRARQLANAWGSRFIDCGEAGHINAESNLGMWGEGHKLLADLDRLGTEIEAPSPVSGTL